MPWEDKTQDKNVRRMAQDNSKDPWGDEPSGSGSNRRPSRLDEYRNRPRPKGSGGNGGGGGRRPSNDLDDILNSVGGTAGTIFNRLGAGGIGFVFVALVALYLAVGGFYQLSPTQGSVNLLFGRTASTGQPGLNWNWPAPFGGRIVVDLAENSFIQGGAIGGTRTGEQLIVTGDKHLISYPIVVKWRVNPAAIKDFVFAYQNPEEVLKLSTETILRDQIGQNLALEAVVQNVEAIRNEIQQELEILLEDQAANLGVVITGLDAVEHEPPRVPSSVQESFEAFLNVQIEETRILEAARRDLNRTLQAARGTEGRVLEDARKITADLVAAGLGEAEALRLVYNGYRADPENAVRRLYEDARRILLSRGQFNVTAEELRLDQILTNSFGGSN